MVDVVVIGCYTSCMYSIIADDAKPHFTNNYLLAQVVQKDMSHGNHQRKFQDPRIVYEDEPKSYHWYLLGYNAGVQASVMIDDLEVSFNISVWPMIKNQMAASLKKSRDLDRSFVKLYGESTILVLTESQANKLKWALFAKNDIFQSLYQAYTGARDNA